MTYEKVVWIDARSEDGWTEQDDLDMRVAEITTLGHVVKETEDVLCIASSLDQHTSQCSGIMFIPKRCILDRQEIVEEKPVKTEDNAAPAEPDRDLLARWMAEGAITTIAKDGFFSATDRHATPEFLAALDREKARIRRYVYHKSPESLGAEGREERLRALFRDERSDRFEADRLDTEHGLARARILDKGVPYTFPEEVWVEFKAAHDAETEHLLREAEKENP